MFRVFNLSPLHILPTKREHIVMSPPGRTQGPGTSSQALIFIEFVEHRMISNLMLTQMEVLKHSL